MLAHSENIQHIAAKMVAVMTEVPSIEKDIKKSEHSGLKYDATSCDAIMLVLRPLMAKHGIAVFSSVLNQQNEAGAKANSVTFNGTVTFTDVDSGEFVTVGFVGQSTNNGPQALYTAFTSAYKYVFIQCFLMDRSGDEVDKVFNGTGIADALKSSDVLYILAAGGGIVTTKSTTKLTESKYKLEVNLPTPTGLLLGSVYARNLDFLTDRDADVYTKLKAAADGTTVATNYPVVLKLGTIASSPDPIPALDVESTNRYLLSLEESL